MIRVACAHTTPHRMCGQHSPTNSSGTSTVSCTCPGPNSRAGAAAAAGAATAAVGCSSAATTAAAASGAGASAAAGVSSSDSRQSIVAQMKHATAAAKAAIPFTDYRRLRAACVRGETERNRYAREEGSKNGRARWRE